MSSNIDQPVFNVMNKLNISTTASRPDFAAIAAWIKPCSKVLDLGCRDGSLLRFLLDTRDARGYGCVIADASLLGCSQFGVSVHLCDCELGLFILAYFMVFSTKINQIN